MIKFCLDVCPIFVKSHFETQSALCICNARRKTISDVDNTIEKNHFLMLKFVCCTNSLMLCPLVVEKLLF